ncbi:MAG: glycosyltransferase family 39 protein [Ignavibacteria bacterium]|nr:glycosyltransferase family 39 protein [Ignavibacteria bacterium]
MATSDNQSKLIWLGLILLVVVGAALRIMNLGMPSFWVDELNHFYAGQSILDGEKPQLPSGVDYKRAPLFNYAVAFSMKVFGQNEFGARFPSVFFGVLAIPILFFITCRFFNEKVALFAALFLTFSPFEIGWSRISKMYTLFQFLYLCCFYAFYMGFENYSASNKISNLTSKAAFSNWGLNWSWLIVTGLLFVIAISVQNLAVVFALSIFSYLSLMVILEAYNHGLFNMFKSKYFVFLVSGCLLGIAIFIVVPALKSRVEFLYSFNPLWAQAGGGKLVYFEFLMSMHLFPLGALFLIGAIQILTRFKQKEYYTLINFIIPILFLSFLVKVRVDRYILNLFPLFCVIAAYALYNLIETEKISGNKVFDDNRLLRSLLTRRMSRILITLLMLCWIPVSRWFYDSLKIPLKKSGKQYIGEYYTNGAVTHREWREASDYVKKRSQADDVVLTTHALTTLYYCGKVDFTIYGGDLGNFRDVVVDENNHKLEPYANVPVVENYEQLKTLVDQHTRGWIIADNSRFNKFIPKDIMDFIQKGLFKLEDVETNNTISVYSWNHHNEQNDR